MQELPKQSHRMAAIAACVRSVQLVDFSSDAATDWHFAQHGMGRDWCRPGIVRYMRYFHSG